MPNKERNKERKNFDLFTCETKAAYGKSIKKNNASKIGLNYLRLKDLEKNTKTKTKKRKRKIIFFFFIYFAVLPTCLNVKQRRHTPRNVLVVAIQRLFCLFLKNKLYF